MDSDTKKIIILAVLAVGILITILLYIFTGLGKTNSSETDTQVGNFPVGQEQANPLPTPEYSSEELPVADTDSDTVALPESDVATVQPVIPQDWRDNVIEYTAPANTTDGYNRQRSTDTTASPYSRSDLNLVEYNTDYRAYAPQTIDLGNGIVIDFEDLQNQEAFNDSVTASLIASVAADFSRPTNCGTIKVPSDESSARRLLDNFNESDAAACMGESIVGDCGTAKLVLTSDGVDSVVYISERADGQCAFAVANNPTYIQLCTIESVLASAGEKRTFSQWSDDYKDKPGDAFAKLYLTFSERITSPDKFDCVLHKTE